MSLIKNRRASDDINSVIFVKIVFYGHNNYLRLPGSMDIVSDSELKLYTLQDL